MKLIQKIKDHFNYEIRITKQIERYMKISRSNGKLGKLRAKLWLNKVRKNSSCNIFPSVTMGKNIYIAHPDRILMGETAKLGNNIIIYPGVQLIANFAASDVREAGRRHPIIEDQCILCVNAIIIGDVVIGKNSIIGAGAIVTHDVPPNTVVTGTNNFHANTHENNKYLEHLSLNTNRKRIMFFDSSLL